MSKLVTKTVAEIRLAREARRSTEMAELRHQIRMMDEFRILLHRPVDHNTPSYLMSTAKAAERIMKAAKSLSREYGAEQKTEKMLKTIRNGVVKRT